MVRLLSLLTLAFLAPMWLMAQWGGEDMDTRQGCLAPGFRSLQVEAARDPYAPPVINLAVPGERVIVSFDELAPEHRYLRYSLIHCDAAWRPEGLVDSEFLDSFNEERIEEWDYSQGTVVGYVHYTLAVPGPDMRITQPGNYLVRVWEEGEPDVPLVQARFGVCDFSVPVLASVSSRTDVDSNQAHQQLSLELDTRHIDVADPFNDLRVVVTQNGRSDNEVTLSTPQRVLGPRIVYDHLRPLIFTAGNEYRRFDLASVNYPGLGVEWIDHDAPVYNAWLYPDRPRSREGYLYDQTQKGRFLVHSVDTDLPQTRADYALVHFSLEMAELEDADVFIEGDLTERHYSPLSRMVYNRATGRYEQSLLLKQGAYNYQYVAIPHGSASGRGDAGVIEGDRYETANEYTVKVYHRPRGSRFDRLVGVTTVTAGL